MAGKKSSRAQKEDYKPVSRFKPNEKLPDDASDMDKAKAEAKKADVESKSALLRALKEEKSEKPSAEKEAEMMERMKRARESDDSFKKLPGKPGEKMQKKTLPGDPNEKPDFKKMKGKK
jgi:hypothetical protein